MLTREMPSKLTESRSTSRENVIEMMPCSRSMDHWNITMGTCAVAQVTMATIPSTIIVHRMSAQIFQIVELDKMSDHVASRYRWAAVKRPYAARAAYSYIRKSPTAHVWRGDGGGRVEG